MSSILDYMRRSDLRAYLFLQVQSIQQYLVPHGLIPTVLAGTAKCQCIDPQSMEVTFGRVDPFRGLGTPGSLRCTLTDPSGFLAELVSGGTETTLTAQIEPDSTTISVVDTTGLPAVVHVHREAIQVTTTNSTTLAIVTRNKYDSHGYPMRHRVRTTADGTKYGSSVRLGSTPFEMSKRWVKVHCLMLDQSGEAYREGGDLVTGEVWRGLITEWDETIDDIHFGFSAETIDTAVQSEAPLCGFNGGIATASRFVQGSQALAYQPVLVQAGRNTLTIEIWDTDLLAAVETITAELATGWHTLSEAAEALMTARGAASIVTGISIYALSDQPTRLGVRVDVDDSGWYEIRLAETDGFWGQLGFAAYVSGMAHYDIVAFASPATASESPAQVYVLPHDTLIPVYTDGDPPPVPGTCKIGDEVIAYSAATEQHIGDQTSYLLTATARAVAGTSAVPLVYRWGESSGDLPKIETACVIGKAGPEASIWTPALSLLTGTGYGENGDYSDDPGLGIASEHFDVAAFEALAPQVPVLSGIQGIVSDLRRLLTDALALEGYAIVPVTTENGCLLTPVYIGAVGEHETAISCRVSMGGNRTIKGGTGDIVNVLRLTFPDETEATYYDEDSIDQFGQQQAEDYEVPLTGSAAALQLAPALIRMFYLRGRKSTLIADLELAPEGRLIQIGDVLSLTFPKSDLTGAWRVLSVAQALAGADGRTRITAYRVRNRSGYIYAPTCTVASVSGGDTINLGTGEGQWIEGVESIYCYPPEDYASGTVLTVASVTGDALDVGDVESVDAGWLVEPYSQERTEYAYIDDDTPATWGE